MTTEKSDKEENRSQLAYAEQFFHHGVQSDLVRD